MEGYRGTLPAEPFGRHRSGPSLRETERCSLLALVASVVLGACSGAPAGSDAPPSRSGIGGAPTGDDASALDEVGPSSIDTGSMGGAAGVAGSDGAPLGGQGGMPGTSIAGAGGRTAMGGSGVGAGGTGAGTGGMPGNCNVPATVSFQRDLQPFLTTACGGGNGCHVIDSASTMAAGGYDHAYDWITAGAHPSSCPATTTPKRFQVVLAVIDTANPASCSHSRIMPPQNETGANLRKPLTACQVAMLQAWLDEPLVTQPHRVDDTDPAGTAPFPMPPFN